MLCYLPYIPLPYNFNSQISFSSKGYESQVKSYKRQNTVVLINVEDLKSNKSKEKLVYHDFIFHTTAHLPYMEYNMKTFYSLKITPVTINEKNESK